MNIAWIGVIMVLCIMVISALLTWRRWPILEEEEEDEIRQQSRVKWRRVITIVSVVGLTVTTIIEANFGEAEKVYLSREPDTRVHLLLKMDNGERSFFVLQNGPSLQCNYINEHGRLTVQTLDSQMTNGVFENDGHYLIEHVEMVTYRYERGFFYGPTTAEEEVVNYELVIPIDGIFVVN